MNYWAPYVLVIASAILAGINLIPLLLPMIALKRWYRLLTYAGWVMLSVAILLTVVFSSRWMVAGLVLIVVIYGMISMDRRRAEQRMDDEAISFMQGLIGLMATRIDIYQALREVARSRDFSRAYPRMTGHAQQIVALLESGKTLTRAVNTVMETIPVSAKEVWRQVSVLAKMLEDTQDIMPPDLQRDTLETAWKFLLEKYNLTKSMRQEMAQMELAKWVMAGILPFINVFMAYTIPGYISQFLLSPVGAIVLTVEFLGVAAIFVVFSRLQQLPEVRI